MAKSTFGFLALLLGGIGYGLCGWQATEFIEQRRRLTTWRPVEAIVRHVGVQERVTTDSKGRKSISYTPVVEYDYEVHGAGYTSTQVFPMPDSGSSAWASRIAHRFREGETCQAYYDPFMPTNSFLVRQVRFQYYAIALLGLAIGCLPFLIWAGTPRTKPVLLPPAPDGWRDVRVARTMRHRSAIAFVAALVVNGGWWSILGHYVWTAEEIDLTSLVVSSGAGLTAGLVPVWYLIRTVLLARCIDEARLLLQPGPLRLGKTFRVRVEQTLKVEANIEELALDLVCDRTTKTTSGGKTRISTQEAHRSRHRLLEGRLVGPGETIAATGEMMIPPHLGATSHGAGAYPRHVWRIEVDTKLSGAPDYRARFPIPVERA